MAPAPQNQEAERAVLGALLLYGEPRYVKGALGRGLLPDHFYWSQHSEIFAACTSLAEQGSKIDPILVAAELDGKHTVEQLDDLTGCVPAAGNLSDYVKLVMTLGVRRERLRATARLREAAERGEDEKFEQILAELRPKPASRGRQTRAQPHLRLVVDGGTGEIVEETRSCPNCQELQDQLDGAAKEIRGWRTRFAKLSREKESEAREHQLHHQAEALFKHWQIKTGHRQSKWSAERFFEAEPLLRKYGLEVFERAIDGIAFNPYTKVRKNGTVQRYDRWATLCKTFCGFEEYACRAPQGWTPTLRIAPQEPVEEAKPKIQAVAERVG